MMNNDWTGGFSDEEALNIIYSGDVEQTMELAKVPTISITILGKLFPLYPSLVMANPVFSLLMNDQDSLLQLFQENKFIIPSIENLSFEWYSWLLKHPDPEVRELTAKSPGLNQNLHRFCSESDDRNIRAGIAANPAIIHSSILDKLRQDTDPAIQRTAKNNSVKQIPPDSVFSESNLGRGLSGVTTALQALADEPVESDNILFTSTSRDYSGILGADNKMHPIVFVCVLLLLLCAGLGLMLFGSKSDKAVTASNLPVITPLPVDEAKYAALMSDAMLIAVSNSSKSKDAETPSQWKQVAQEWDNAIESLEKVPPSSGLYKAAQERIDIYRASRSAAKKRIL
jgi:hypothetical protein